MLRTPVNFHSKSLSSEPEKQLSGINDSLVLGFSGLLTADTSSSRPTSVSVEYNLYHSV